MNTYVSKIIKTFHSDQITSIAIYKDKYLITASYDETVHIYNIKTGRKVRQFNSMDDSLLTLIIVKPIFLCFSDQCERIILCNLEKMKIIQRIEYYNGFVLQLLDLEDKKNILFSDEKRRIGVWNYLEKNFRTILYISSGFFPDNHEDIEFNNITDIKLLNKIDKIIIVSQNNGTISIVKINNECSKGEIIKIYVLEYEIHSLCLDGNYLFLGCNKNLILYTKFDSLYNYSHFEKFIISDNFNDFNNTNAIFYHKYQNLNLVFYCNKLEEELKILNIDTGEYKKVENSINSVLFDGLNGRIEVFKQENQTMIAVISHEINKPIYIYTIC